MILLIASLLNFAAAGLQVALVSNSSHPFVNLGLAVFNFGVGLICLRGVK